MYPYDEVQDKSMKIKGEVINNNNFALEIVFSGIITPFSLKLSDFYKL